ncbi:MAG: hypothetical protein V2J24_11735 [Pseudomonadales bacterium]|jgi:hypothetical protein|nr:hypothetical protein [Pseudomonadales bacterium]
MKPLPMPLVDALCTFAALYFALLLYVDRVSHHRAFLVLAAFVASATATVAALLGRWQLAPLAVLMPVAAAVTLVVLRRGTASPWSAQLARGAFLLFLAAALLPVWVLPRDEPPPFAAPAEEGS